MNEGQPQRIATAYLVERDGTIFEVFDPRFWAFHLGGGSAERRSIGIEMASEAHRALMGVVPRPRSAYNQIYEEEV